MDRFSFERHVEAAALAGPQTAILMMLARRVNRAAGQIPDRDQPSLSALAMATGYHKTTVIRHLRALEAAGWVHRAVPPVWAAQKLHMTTSYTLLIPEGYPQASSRARLEQVAREQMACSAGAASQVAAGGGPGSGTGPGQVAARPGAGSTRRHKGQETSPDKTARSSSRAGGDLAQLVIDELAALTGRRLTRAQAAEAARLVLEGRDVRSPAAYLRQALREDPRRYIPAGGGPPPLADYEAQLHEQLRADKDQEDTT